MWFHTLSLEPIFSFNIFHFVVKLNIRRSEKKKSGHPIPKIDYTCDEVKIWNHIYVQLNEMYEMHVDAF